MPFLHCRNLTPALLGFAAFLGASEVHVAAHGVTPVEKVIKLLMDLEKEVKDEGAKEAAAYETYSCFCQTNTDTKSNTIVTSKAKIDELSASLAENTAQKQVDEQELAERQVKHESLESDLKATELQFDKETAEHEAETADLARALKALSSAEKALTDAKPSAAVLLSVRETVSSGLALARSLKLDIADASQGFLQARATVDPLDPKYKYHSQGILDTITSLLQEFRAKQTEMNAEWTKTENNFKDMIKDFNDKIGANKDRIGELDTSIEGLKGDIADDRKALVLKDAELKDAKVFLKDLTEQCEARAKDWDQRSQMRADEVEALEGALNVLNARVKGADTAVNERALLLEHKHEVAYAAPKAKSSPVVAKVPQMTLAEALKEGLVHWSSPVVAPSFLQGAAISEHDHARVHSGEQQSQVAEMLQQESRRLKSEVLSSILGRVSNDPFEKVKQLIQNLIERLLAETNSEAKKEHFCREALAKAEKDRDYRLEDAKKVNVELVGLESKRDELEEEIATLTADLSDLNTTLVEATEQREVDHENNMETIAEAKGGLDAVTEAIVILKTFYKQAANAALVQASPVDEATDGPGFSGSYKGRQESSKGIIGLLEVIKTDFERTISKTKTSEEEGLKMFVELERSAKADIAGKTTKKELDEEDLETTKSDIETKMDDLKAAMNLVDSSLDQLQALKPTCTDFGMSYEDRKEKREQEIAALKKAMCQLSPDGKIDC